MIHYKILGIAPANYMSRNKDSNKYLWFRGNEDTLFHFPRALKDLFKNM